MLMKSMTQYAFISAANFQSRRIQHDAHEYLSSDVVLLVRRPSFHVALRLKLFYGFSTSIPTSVASMSLHQPVRILLHQQN